MTPLETIYKMLGEPGHDDEINAQIWCWVSGKPFVKIGIHPIAGHSMFYIDYDGREMARGFCKYTTSLDAAMSIGAKELEGWWITSCSVGWASIHNHNIVYARKKTFVSPEIEWNQPRAICHARLQALEYVREQT